MRNWSNRTVDMTLEEATEQALAGHHGVSLIGMEVEGVSSWVRGERRVLAPTWDSIGFPPHVGTLVHIGSTPSEWRVLRVAEIDGSRAEIRDRAHGPDCPVCHLPRAAGGPKEHHLGDDCTGGIG